MALPLDAATHILIETLLTQGFENKLIASKAKCSKRAVERIRRKRQQPEMPTPRTKRGRRSCITSPMKKNILWYTNWTALPISMRDGRPPLSSISQKNFGTFDRSDFTINWVNKNHDSSNRSTTWCRLSRSLFT